MKTFLTDSMLTQGGQKCETILARHGHEVTVAVGSFHSHGARVRESTGGPTNGIQEDLVVVNIFPVIACCCFSLLGGSFG